MHFTGAVIAHDGVDRSHGVGNVGAVFPVRIAERVAGVRVHERESARLRWREPERRPLVEVQCRTARAGPSTPANRRRAAVLYSLAPRRNCTKLVPPARFPAPFRFLQYPP